jgi:serine/threonine-protein kinase
VSDDLAVPWALGAFPAGYRIAGYRLDEEIGRGGMAVVLRAHDERLRRQVALKILAPTLAADQAFRRRFIRESQAAAAVDDPNIIPVFEAGESSGVLFIAMRLVRGGDVRALVGQHGPLPAWRAMWIVAAVASALDAAHAAGLVHRDVKPANMLLDVRPGRPDHVYVSDFGLSKSSLGTSGLTGSGQFLGTVDYAAPEQLSGRAVDGQADQYALGCAAYELLCGWPPFRRDQGLAVVYAHLSEPPPLLSAQRSGLPAAVDAVFTRALAKSPGDRFASCQEFAESLRVALGLRPQVDDREADLLTAAAGETQQAGAAPAGGALADAAAPVTRTQGPARKPGQPRRRRAAAGGGPAEPAPPATGPERSGLAARPATEPAAPAGPPARPETEPAAPAGRLGRPETEPAVPVGQPDRPATEPAAAMADPAPVLIEPAPAQPAASDGTPASWPGAGIPGASGAGGTVGTAGRPETPRVPGPAASSDDAGAAGAARDSETAVVSGASGVPVVSGVAVAAGSSMVSGVSAVSGDRRAGEPPGQAAAPGGPVAAPSRLRVPAMTRRLQNHSRGVLAGGVAAVIGLIAIVAVAVLLLTQSHAPAPAAASSRQPSVRTYTFSPHLYPDGVVVTRHWTLTGPGGSVLKESLRVSNPTSAPVTLLLMEPVPASITKHLTAVAFTPAPDKIRAKDAVAEWKLRLPAHGSTTITYQVQVPALGATTARLRAWAADVNAAEAQLPQSAASPGVRSLTVAPRVLRIAAGRTRQLRLSGTLPSGAKAGAAMLAKATWRTANRSIATVTSAGKVTGRVPGTTQVTVRLGAARATVRVTVTGKAQHGASGGVPTNPPSSGPAPGSSPTPRQSPTSGPTNPAPSPSPTITGTPLPGTASAPAGMDRSLARLIILRLRASLGALTSGTVPA